MQILNLLKFLANTFVSTVVVMELWSLPAITRTQLNGQLVVEVNGLRNQQGQMCFSVFSESQGFPDQSDATIQKQCVEITSSPVSATFNDLQPGSYAVAVLHDANRDNTANRNFLGIPVEGFGFSQNPVIRTGPPRFNDAAVVVAGRTNVQVRLNYF